MIRYHEFQTPLGRMRVATDGSSLVGTWFVGQKYDPVIDGWRHEPACPLLIDAERQLGAYFEGKCERFELPLATRGTSFQQSVWHAIQTIPLGRTEATAAWPGG